MKKPIKVLHVYKTFYPDSVGGVEQLIDTISSDSMKDGVQNTVFCLSKLPKDKLISHKGYQIHQVKQHVFIFSTGFSFTAFSKFKLLAQQADIIHYHFPNPFGDILHFFCGIKKPTLVTYHSDVVKQKLALKLYHPLQSWFLRSVDRIVATSPNYLKSSAVLQRFSDKVSVIPIGVDIDSYPVPRDERVQFWKDKLKAPFFLFVGALRYYKGLHIAIDAVADTDIQLVIAGAGGIEHQLKQQAKLLDARNVKFFGFISDEDKVVLLKLCYAFVFPSHLRSEAFGISLLEAAAYGKPLVSCEIGTGTTFINIANETGVVVPPESSFELRKSMRRLLENPVAAAEMGKRAERRARKVFTASQQMKAYHKLYRDIASSKVLVESGGENLK